MVKKKKPHLLRVAKTRKELSISYQPNEPQDYDANLAGASILGRVTKLVQHKDSLVIGDELNRLKSLM